MPTRLPLTLLAITISALVMARPLFAQDHQLVMTENSSLSLSVTYDGSSAGITVAPNGADSWLVTFPSTTHLGFELDWQEPGDPTLVNDFNIYPPDIGASNTWVVSSEFMLPGGATHDAMQPPDGHTFIQIGGDFSDLRQIDATFHDVENISSVPEPATWASGFLTATGIVCVVWRKRTAFRKN